MIRSQRNRQVLRKLTVGRLAVTPNEDRTEFKITGTGLLEPLIERALGVPKALVTPAGFDDFCTDADNLSVEVYGLVPR